MTEEELLGFYQRGILHISDHVRTAEHADWMPVTEWAVSKGCTSKSSMLQKATPPVKGQGKAA
ncbi:MAG: hypothetical protein JWO08_2985 [Verrucomicrobiaceae bacterium]|nr:hypothetical protein [Verrucomicrobiaceae bacterium]